MADLAAIAAAAVAVAFDVAGTAKTTTAVLHVGKAGVYDPITGTTTKSGGADIPITDGVLYRAKQAQGTAESRDTATFIFPGASAPDGVDEADAATIDGEDWNIVDVVPVPTKAVVMLQLRR